MTRLDDLPDLLTVEEARKVLRVGRNQMYAALHDGTVPAIRVGRSWRVGRHVIERLMNGDDPASTGSSESSSAGDSEEAHRAG